MRVALSLLHTLEDAAAIEAMVRCILPKVTTLSSKVELVLLVAYNENLGEKLVSKETASELERALSDEIHSASADTLAGERYLARVLALVNSVTDPTVDPFDIPESPKLTFAILRAYRTSVSASSLNSRTISVTFDLNWESLIRLYGDEAKLKVRIESLKAEFEELKPWIKGQGIPLDEAESLLELANKHLSG